MHLGLAVDQNAVGSKLFAETLQSEEPVGTFERVSPPVIVEKSEKEREPVREETILAQKTNPSQMRNPVQILKDLQVAFHLVDCTLDLQGYILQVTSQADRCNEGAAVLDMLWKHLGYGGNVVLVKLNVGVSSNLMDI